MISIVIHHMNSTKSWSGSISGGTNGSSSGYHADSISSYRFSRGDGSGKFINQNDISKIRLSISEYSRFSYSHRESKKHIYCKRTIKCSLNPMHSFIGLEI